MRDCLDEIAEAVENSLGIKGTDFYTRLSRFV